MPSRNIVKQYASDNFYHAYNRGVNKCRVFMDDEDYRVFLNLLKRYLSPRPELDRKGRQYKNFSKEVELLAYCLMPNHFHLYFYLLEDNGMHHLLQAMMTSYSIYFNKRHSRIGGLFQDRFKAVDVCNESYYWHISRYIHLNPTDINHDWRTYPYSSLVYYERISKADWIKPERVLDIFGGSIDEYLDFLSDYEDYKLTLKEVKNELADG